MLQANVVSNKIRAAVPARVLLAVGAMLTVGTTMHAAEPDGPTSSNRSTEDSNDFRCHQVASEYQAGETTVRVLLPERFDPSRRYRVIYVLPVHAQGDFSHGDGLAEMKKHDYHARYDLIFVAPSFTDAPSFADHDGNPAKREESYFVKVVVPFVDQHYPTIARPDGRLLLGFSKSGWGAFTLLLRNPAVFGKAVGWDSAFGIDTGPITDRDRARRIAKQFGSQENFERYRISTLLRERGGELGNNIRLFFYCTSGLREPGNVQLHRLMLELGIPHRYLYEPNVPHRWDTGWIPQAVRFLVEDKDLAD